MSHEISAVVLTKNEEKTLRDCLKSIAWVDEIIVIDDVSDDKTAAVAKIFTKNIFSKKLSNDFAAQRNFGLEKAKGEWVLFLDADEIVSDALRQEIQEEIATIKKETQGFFVKRIDILWGKEFKHGDVGNAYLLRLARKGSGLWKGMIHEAWDIKGDTMTLHEPLLHYPHQTIQEFLSEINFYSTLRANELYKEGIKSSFLAILIYTKMKFFFLFIVKGGFLDGTRGMMHALMMSYYSFLTRAKLYLLWLDKKNK